MSPGEFLKDRPDAQPLFAAVLQAVASIGKADIRVSKSRIAFRRKKNFAFVWEPGQYLRGKTAPLVLTIALPYRVPGARWKEVVAPAPGHFTHHLELYKAADVDEEVAGWLRQAWETAG